MCRHNREYCMYDSQTNGGGGKVFGDPLQINLLLLPWVVSFQCQVFFFTTKQQGKKPVDEKGSR